MRTQTNALPSAADANAAATVRSIPLQNNAADDVDDADAKRLTQSAPKNTGTPGWRARKDVEEFAEALRRVKR